MNKLKNYGKPWRIIKRQWQTMKNTEKHWKINEIKMKSNENEWKSMQINESQCSPGLSPDFRKMISLKSLSSNSILFFLRIAIWSYLAPTGHLAGPGRPWVLMGLVFYRCAATILVATVATLRRKWRSFHKVLVNHHLNDSNCNTSRVNLKLIFTKNAPGSASLSSDFRKMISFKSLL